jgi:hypothetical protein
MTKLRTLILPAADAPEARRICQGIDPTNYSHLWRTPLSTTGQPPGEWYISTGLVSELFADLIPLDEFVRGEMGVITGITRVYPGKPAEIQQMLVLAGMDIPVWAVEGIFEACRVLPEPPDVVLGYYGLRLVQTDIGGPSQHAVDTATD